MKKREFTPSVLVLKEKHGTAYYHVPDEATLHRVALLILKGRQKSGYWYDKPKKPKALDYTDENEIRTTLRGHVQMMALSALVGYEQEMREYEQDRDQYADIQEAILRENGALAWEILQERSKHEYEQVSLEPYSTSYG